MPDFSKAKVYRLVNDVDDEVYVGATCCRLSDRLACHKIDARRKPERRVYAHVAATGGWANWHIVLVEAVPCANREELRAHERRHVELIGTLNICLPGRTGSEWYDEKRDEINEKKRAYYAVNRDKIAERRHTYYAENRDEIAEKKRAYYAEHKGTYAEYERAHRVEINARRRALYAARKAGAV